MISKMRENKRNWFSIIITYSIVCGMVAVSEILGEREVIFPEMAAIAVGSFLAPKFAWNTSKPRMIVGIILCAICGVGIVYLQPGPLWLQLAIAYVIGRAVLLCLRVSFAPMISAIVLPVMLQTKSPIYLISAFVLTCLVVVIRIALETQRIYPHVIYEKKAIDIRKELKNIMICGIVVLAFAICGISVGWNFIIAPPLLVAFTEFSNPESKARKMPMKAVLVISGCALFGSVCRYLISIKIGLPLTLATAIGLFFVIILLRKSRLYIPPAGAMMVLAMLIPEEAVILYPVQVVVGMALLMIVDVFVFRKRIDTH